jgi:hypothetical protein
MRLASSVLRAALFAAAAVLQVSVCAQGNPEQVKFREEVLKLCERSIATATDKIRPLIADEYPELSRRSDLVVFAPFAEFGAFAVYTQRRVVITWGMCYQLWLLMSGAAIAEHFPESRHRLQEYLQYLIDRTLEIERTAPRGRIVESEILTFDLFARLNIRRVSKRQLDVIWAVISDVMPNAFSFAIGHEIGHLALGHRRYDAITSREAHAQELAADRFGGRLTASILGNDFDPSFMSSLLLLMQRESNLAPNGSTTHPPTQCRLGRAVTQIGIFERMAANRELARDFRRRTGHTLEDAASLMRKAGDECGQ